VTKTVSVEKRFVEIEDHGIKLRLTIVDTPGFNDMVDASRWYDNDCSVCLSVMSALLLCYEEE